MLAATVPGSAVFFVALILFAGMEYYDAARFPVARSRAHDADVPILKQAQTEAANLP